MSTPPENPFSPPSAHVADIYISNGEMQFHAPAEKVDVSRATSWIGEGWASFKTAPLLWIVAAVVSWVLLLMVNLIPLIGGIIGILAGPFFMVGLLAFAHGIDSGEEADISKLFAGFQNKIGPLLGVAALYFAAWIAISVVIIVMAIVVGVGIGTVGTMDGFIQSMRGGGFLLILLGVFVVLALVMLVIAAYWYAPGLVYFADMSPTDAMKESLMACFRNWLPLLVYSIVVLLVIFLGMMALGVGLLVAMPVIAASYYANFKDFFGSRS